MWSDLKNARGGHFIVQYSIDDKNRSITTFKGLYV